MSLTNSSSSIKDRNGVDIHVGDMVSFLVGSLDGNHYEAMQEVVEINGRHKIVKLADGSYRYWHEFWAEEE